MLHNTFGHYNRFAEALDLSTKNIDRLREIDPMEVGKKYIRHLIDHRNFERASRLLPQVND